MSSENQTKVALGLKFTLFDYRFRFWWKGFEVSKGYKGRFYFFPWGKP